MTRLEQAADQAIHQLQLTSRDAIRYVESQVAGVSREQILAALVGTMTFHQERP